MDAPIEKSIPTSAMMQDDDRKLEMNMVYDSWLFGQMSFSSSSILQPKECSIVLIEICLPLSDIMSVLRSPISLYGVPITTLPGQQSS